MKKIVLSQVDLKNQVKRKEFSDKLKKFETSFEYPLGQKKFSLKHGENINEDYFSFFEQMGEVYYFVAEDEGVVVGAGCAILRQGEEGKFWYLCDLKVLKSYRGHGIMEAMYKKYMWKCILKSRKMITVNMGNGDINKNGLLKKTQKLLKMFNVKVKSLNFHTWKKSSLPKDLCFITTNNGRKDLIIDGMAQPLFHGSPKKLNGGFIQYELQNVLDDYDVMTCVPVEDDRYGKESISGHGILMSVGLKKPEIFTVEI